MNKIAAFLFAFGVATVSISAWAQGGYVGVGFGQTSVDLGPCELDISCTSDDSDTAFKIFGGYKFNPNWGIEGAYIDAGELSQSGTDSFLGTASATIEVSGINLAVLGIIPVSERFSLQGKAGLFLWDMDVSFTSSVFGPASLNEGGTSPMFGIGGTFNINKQIGILVEYEKYLDVGEEDITGEEDVDILSASLVFNF
jgi:OOP family OmpA-OmpF porin